METRKPLDLWALMAASAVALVLVLLRAPFGLRVAGGLVLALCPGYALVALLYPERHDPLRPDDPRGRSLDGLGRAVFSPILSLCLFALAALVLTGIGRGLTERRLAVTMGLVVLALGGLALAIRAFDVPPDRRPAFRVAAPRFQDPVRTLLLALLTLGSLAGLVLAALQAFPLADPEPGYTSFFFQPIGDLHCHPLRYQPGPPAALLYQPDPRCPSGPINLTVEVVNHEGHLMQYRIASGWGPASISGSPDIPDGDAVLLPDAGPVANGTDEAQYTLKLDLPPPPGHGLQYFTATLFSAPDGQPFTAEHRQSLQLRVVVP